MYGQRTTVGLSSEYEIRCSVRKARGDRRFGRWGHRGATVIHAVADHHDAPRARGSSQCELLARREAGTRAIGDLYGIVRFGMDNGSDDVLVWRVAQVPALIPRGWPSQRVNTVRIGWG